MAEEPQFRGITDGSITIRPMVDAGKDVEVMSRWLTDERVLEFYEGRDNPWDVARIHRELLVKAKARDEMPCIVELDGRSIGYLQFYPVGAEELKEDLHLDSFHRVFGIDQFIGEPGLWGKGIGRHMIGLVLTYLFDQAGADLVILDPVVTNTRAIRCYEACGFEGIAVLPEHEMHEGIARDVLLMGVTPQTFRNVTADYRLNL